jgi:hypothetical protein
VSNTRRGEDAKQRRRRAARERAQRTTHVRTKAHRLGRCECVAKQRKAAKR